MHRRSSRIELLVWLVALAALGSCGDSLEVNNVEPTGSVGGVVWDAYTRQPIAGVSVSLLAGGRVYDPEVTGEDGTYGFGSVPAGDVLVTMTPPADSSYQPTVFRVTLPTSAGEFPIGEASVTVGPIGLIPLSETLRIRVLDMTGAPAVSYPLSLQTFVQHIDYTPGYAIGRGETLATVTTDADGYASVPFPSFARLGPQVNGTLVMLLPPLDSDADGIYEYPGGDQALNARSFGDATPDVILNPSYATALGIRASTIGGMVTGATNPAQTIVGVSSSVSLAFNLPIQPNPTVVVSNELGQPLDPQPPVSVSDDSITISFSSSPLAPGEEYNLQVHAVSSVGQRQVIGDFGGQFFTRALSPEVSVASITRDPATQVVNVVFNQPIGGVAALNGGNCVLWFAANLGGAASIGDVPGELGNPSCDGRQFYPVEPDPPGIVGGSGYSKYWQFVAPLDGNGAPLLTNTRVHILFSRVVNSNRIVIRPDGSPVEDFTDSVTSSIPLP